MTDISLIVLGSSVAAIIGIALGVITRSTNISGSIQDSNEIPNATIKF
jgi:hypothetical protein